MIRDVARRMGPVKVLAMAARSDAPLRNLMAFRRNARYARVSAHTLVSYQRLLDTERLARACIEQTIEGSFVECGVWRGGVAGLMAQLARGEGRGRHTHLFDSFEGLPQPTPEDGKEAVGLAMREHGEALNPVELYRAGREDVEDLLFGALGLSDELVQLHQGWFQDVLSVVAPALGPIALLRIDADWYDSVRCCLQHLYPLVVSGGYVILDDYGGYPGCKQAWDEFAAENEVAERLHRSDEYGVWMRKP